MLTMISKILIFWLRTLGIAATAKRAHASKAQTYRKFSKISGKFFFNFELRRSAEAEGECRNCGKPGRLPWQACSALIKNVVNDGKLKIC